MEVSKNSRPIKNYLTNICFKTKDNVNNCNNKKKKLRLTFSIFFFQLTIYLLICLTLFLIFCLPSGRDSYLNNKIAAGFESGLCTDLILINLQNAFDTVNNNVLLKKKDFIGLYEEKAKWFKSYLSNRKIKVLIKSTFSEPGNYFNAEFLKDPFYIL